jgi:hypothetical protein
MKSVCAQCVEEHGLLDLMVRLLDSTQQCLTAAASDTSTQNPKFVHFNHFFVPGIKFTVRVIVLMNV